MSRLKKENAFAVKEFNEFRGIDTRFAGSGNGDTREVANYRILHDGSLKKRGGIKFVTSFEKDIRALWTGYIKDVFTGYVLVGNYLYRLDFDDSGEYSSSTRVGPIQTTEGAATIFYYYGYIFIADGYRIYVLSGNMLKVADGYAPLYGKDWPTGIVGEVNEPLNFFTKRARISYVVSDPPNIFLCTKHPVEKVDAMFVNGVMVTSDTYEIDNDLGSVNIPLYDPGTRIVMYLTYSSMEGNLTALRSSDSATIFGGMNNSRVFLWNKSSNKMFASTFVPSSSIDASARIYGKDGVLYFTTDNEITVGDGSKYIKGVSRHYDRLLLFTGGETWMADSPSCDTEAVPVMRINSQNGASSEYGITRCANDPISVDNGRILRWQTNTDEFDDFNAYSISDGIKEILPAGFFKNAVAFEDKFHGEVLFAKRDDSEGRIFVYEEKNKNWFTYENISVDGFFNGKSNVGFYHGSKIYMFDDSQGYDSDADGAQTPIQAYLTTYPIDFGLPYRKKRLGIMGVLADLGKDSVRISFSEDNGNTREFSVSGEDSEYVESYVLRLVGERFVRTSLRIDGGDDLGQRIYKLTVTAKH